MDILKANMNIKTSEGYKTIYPTTTVDQVITNDGSSLEEYISNNGGSSRIVRIPFVIEVEQDGQTVFPVDIDNYSPTKDNVEVHLNGEFLHKEEEFTFKNYIDSTELTLVNRTTLAGDKIHISVEKSVVVDPQAMGLYSTDMEKFTVEATTQGQKVFDFQDPTFVKAKNKTIVFLQSEILVEDLEYVVSETGSKITLTEGAYQGQKVHIIVLRVVPHNIALESEGVTPEQKEMITTLVTPGKYYVDPVNGNDANDGRSEASAFRTIQKVNEFLSFKSSSNTVTISLAPGNYAERFNISNFNGVLNITTSGTGTSYAILSNIKEHVFNRISTLVINGYVRFKNTGNVANLHVTEVTNLAIHPKVDIDSGSTGIYAERTQAYIQCSFGGQTGSIMNLSVLADFVCAGHSFNGPSSLITLLCAAKYRSYMPREGSRLEVVDDWTNSAMDFNKIANGVMIEAGANSNGQFWKFADGTVFMAKTIGIAASTANLLATQDIVFPITPTAIFYKDVTVKEVSANFTYNINRLTLENVYSSGVPVARRVFLSASVAQTYTLEIFAVGVWK